MEKRKYCNRCGEDVTIIALHTCLDGLQYADYGNMIYQESRINVREIIDGKIGTEKQRKELEERSL